MTTARLFDDRQRAGTAGGEPAKAIVVAGDGVCGDSAPQPGWERQDGGADAFALSKRLRYLDWMAGFDGRRRVA